LVHSELTTQVGEAEQAGPRDGSGFSTGRISRLWQLRRMIVFQPLGLAAARRVSTLLLLGLVGGLAGCQNVKPWQRGTLSDVTMRADRDPLGLSFREHMWFSREAAAGGRGIGGGGCGCN